ncbi:MAG: hypothetical protein KF833_23425 [Verrucomicrobiae bacterium]|nr:hypothetical protein [Verrucomicrobiae bacterium]
MRSIPFVLGCLAALGLAGSASQGQTYYSTTVMGDGPLLYWNFDEADGDVLQRMPIVPAPVGTANDLIPAGDAGRVGHGAIGSGLNLGRAASLGGSGAFAASGVRAGRAVLPGAYGVEFWVQFAGPTGAGGRNEYLVNFGGNSPAFIYDFTPTEIEMYTTGGAIGGRTAGGPVVTDGAWHHVLFAYYGDGTDGVADRVDAYLDGEAYPYIGNFISRRLSLANVVVGASSALGVNGLNGHIDEVAVYDWSGLADEAAVSARVEAIVTGHRAAAMAAGGDYGSVVRAHEPLLYWNFDEEEGPARQLMDIVFPPVTHENDLVPQLGAWRASHEEIESGLELGRAADLDGTSYFEAEALRATVASLGPPWALEFWMQVQGENNGLRQDYLVAFGPTGNDPAFIYDYKPNQLEVYHVPRTDNGPIVHDTDWHHVVWVYYGNGTEGVADRMDVYLDGVPMGNVRNTFGRAIRLDSVMRVGAALPGGVNGFEGRLDEVAIYDLSSAGDAAAVEARVSAMVSRHYAAAFGDPGMTTLTLSGQPGSVVGAIGETATFTVVATLTGAPAGAVIEYQWQRNGANLPGATGPSYTTPTLRLADVGEASYRVRVSYGGLVEVSEPARLTVPAPASPGPTPYSAVVLADGPVAYWNFDEGSGGAIQRAPLASPAPLTTENDLVPMFGAYRTLHSELGSGLDLGRAADLDGVSHFEAEMLRAPKRSLAAPWAVEFWMQVQGDNSGDRQDYLVAFGPSGNDPAFIYDYKPDQLEMFHGQRTDGGPVISDEAWHHVMWVFYGDGTVGVANRVDAYLDGERIGNVRNTFSRELRLDSVARVGAALPSGVGGFEGRLDEVAIYDLGPVGDAAAIQARVETMIERRLARARSSGGDSYASLVLGDDPILYWNFDEADGNALQRAPVVLPDPDNTRNTLAAMGGVRADHAALGSGLTLGYAGEFDGSGRFQASGLELGRAGLSGPYAIELWFQIQGANDGERQDYLANFGPNAPGVIYDYKPDELELFGGAGGRTDGGPILSDNAWHHLMWVYYGDGERGVADRVDAILDGERYPHIGNSLNRTLVLDPVVVGAANLAGANGFEGRIDEVALYDLSGFTDEAALEAATTGMVARRLAAAREAAPIRPSLGYVRSGNQLTLTWAGTGFLLESAEAVSGASWSPVAGGGTSPVTVSIEGEAGRYYRLRTP